jgi:hypothetical protein
VVTFSEVHGYVLTAASEEDLRLLQQAIQERRRTFGLVRAASVQVGGQASIEGLTPRILNGLRGTVESLHNSRASVKLDTASTRLLAYGRSRFSTKAAAAFVAGEGFLVEGVPATCCVAIATPATPATPVLHRTNTGALVGPDAMYPSDHIGGAL